MTQLPPPHHCETTRVSRRRRARRRGPRQLRRALALAALTLALPACIRAPDVVVVDRTTALEEQAAGRYATLERELVQAGVSPRPQPYTRGQLDKAGWTTPRERDAVAQLTEAALRHRARIDALLVRRCIGEASTGTLQLTRDACQGAIDVAAVSRLIERANRDRRQVWLYLARATRRPVAKAQSAWRARHLEQVVCGGWVQDAKGRWAARKC